MITDDLNIILDKPSNNILYTRSLLKEALQNYVLNFVYNDPDYKNLIFTGGTCLRKIYGLPRLSEDLDFDVTFKFDIEMFSSKVKKYFAEELSYKEMMTKISGNNKTVFLKFPVNIGNSPMLFVRCDFAVDAIGNYETEINSISTGQFTIFTKAFDLPTLFANKIAAFLQRNFFKGKEQAESFKGRDLFDLVWFLEKSKKTEWELKPNWERLSKSLGKDKPEEIRKMLVSKVQRVNKTSVYNDLLPFIESNRSAESFSDNFCSMIVENIKFVL